MGGSVDPITIEESGVCPLSVCVCVCVCVCVSVTLLAVTYLVYYVQSEAV